MEGNLRRIVSEELAKFISEDSQVFEASVSAGLSFMQDIRGSSKKVKGQIGLSGTNSEVDAHLKKGLKHIDEAIQSYFKTLSPEVKLEVAKRIGEVNIDDNEY